MRLRPWFTLALAAVPLLIALLWVATAAAASLDGPPVTPHPLDGRADCLVCHKTSGSQAMPANHEGRASATCVSCHPAGGPASTASTPTAPAASVTAPQSQSSAPKSSPTTNESCLACHQDASGEMTFADGQSISLGVDGSDFEGSVHGSKGLACVDCHVDIKGYPHPKQTEVTYRDYALAADQLCQKCHSENYAKAHDSVHGDLISEGNQAAPSCTDCHGAHDVAPPDQPRQRGSQTCAKCHEQVYADYSSSVHGSALLNESNEDVAVCTDCHGVHDIADPRTAEFRVQSPDLCAKCHSDEAKMAKYGMSSKVTATYEREFHGVTATIYKTSYPTVWCYKAVCTDCHGVHNIVQSDLPTSSVHKDNLPETCSQCHLGASANFASAWIGHYEPSPDNSPLVYYVNLFYQIFIPLLMFGLLAFIGLEVFHRLRLWLRPTGRR
ncbi:MAG: cytochrome c3 family protein [Chloroflexota bacterium]